MSSSGSPVIDNATRNRHVAAAKRSLDFLKESIDSVDSKRLEELDKLFSDDTGIWERDVRMAKKLAREQRQLKEKIEGYWELDSALMGSIELSNLAQEEDDLDVVADCAREIGDIATRARQAELESLLRGPADQMGCYVEVSAGTGGTEAMDFAGQLLRMYELWGSIQGFPVQVKEKQDGPEAGIRSCVVAVQAPYAYGWLKGEHGTHRICRVSPYDAAQRRHTSFAQVAVFPMDFGQESDVEIELKESELRIDTFRSSGPGGQSVNTTSSAVRIVHLPTGISASSQNERSQFRNKATAMSVLKAKLLALQLKAKAEEQAKLRSTLGEASFGTQIRSYYWNPQKFVKDHRSGYEEQDAMGVMDGEKIQPFMEAFLQWEYGRSRE